MQRLVFLLLCAQACALACAQPTTRGRVGEPAPEYAARTLNGDSLALADLRGQVVLLNVWATWCIPCRKELPELQALHERYATQGLRVVGVSVDDGSNNAVVREFAKQFGVTYTILRDPAERVLLAFLAAGVPTTVLIDREGKVAWRYEGRFSGDNPTLQKALSETL